MSLFNIFILFWINFFGVFLLGIQSRNVVAGLHLASSVTTVFILGSQTLFIQYATKLTPLMFFISAIGCIAGINCSILFSQRFLTKKKANAVN